MILNRDEFFQRIHERMPDTTNADDIGFLEDMTDTYNDLENRANTDAENWKKKYEDNDRSWREKYKHRFFNGGDRSVPNQRPDEDIISPDNISVDDLFT